MSNQLLIVGSVFLSSFLGMGAAGLPMAGPVAIAAGLGTLAWTQRRRGLAWSDFGLVRPRGAGRLALLTLGCLLAGWTAAGVGMVLATRAFGWTAIDTGRFAGIEGNLPMLLGMLAISWTTAAFGEELLFRGFLQTRLAGLFRARRHAGLWAAVAQALLFGLGHAYQGATGVLTTGLLGLAFGLCRLRLRSLWPLVIAHGLIDTVSMVALYLGARPGA